MTKTFFEASFTNLDLSEFDTPSSTTTTSTPFSSTSLNAKTNNGNINHNTPSLSASEQLLLTKQKESDKKQFELEQEEYIQMKAKQRQAEYIMKQQQQKQQQKGNDDGDGITGGNKNDNRGGVGNVINALLSMHGNDLFGKQLERSGSKTKAQRQTLNKKIAGTKKIKKGGVVKKSRKTKHYKR